MNEQTLFEFFNKTNNKNPTVKKYFIKLIKTSNIKLEYSYINEIYNKFVLNISLLKDLDIFKLDNFEDVDDIINNAIIKHKNKKFCLSFISKKYKKLIDEKTYELFGILLENKINRETIQECFIKTIAAFNNKDEFNYSLEQFVFSVNNIKSKNFIINYCHDNNIDILYNENNEIVIKINNFENSKILGSSSWCISRHGHSFYNYLKNKNDFLSNILNSIFNLENTSYFLFHYNFNKKPYDKDFILGYTIINNEFYIAYDNHNKLTHKYSNPNIAKLLKKDNNFSVDDILLKSKDIEDSLIINYFLISKYIPNELDYYVQNHDVNILDLFNFANKKHLDLKYIKIDNFLFNKDNECLNLYIEFNFSDTFLFDFMFKLLDCNIDKNIIKPFFYKFFGIKFDIFFNSLFKSSYLINIESTKKYQNILNILEKTEKIDFYPNSFFYNFINLNHSDLSLDFAKIDFTKFNFIDFTKSYFSNFLSILSFSDIEKLYYHENITIREKIIKEINSKKYLKDNINRTDFFSNSDILSKINIPNIIETFFSYFDRNPNFNINNVNIKMFDFIILNIKKNKKYNSFMEKNNFLIFQVIQHLKGHEEAFNFLNKTKIISNICFIKNEIIFESILKNDYILDFFKKNNYLIIPNFNIIKYSYYCSSDYFTKLLIDIKEYIDYQNKLISIFNLFKNNFDNYNDNQKELICNIFKIKKENILEVFNDMIINNNKYNDYDYQIFIEKNHKELRNLLKKCNNKFLNYLTIYI